jgi:hypothetical protein
MKTRIRYRDPESGFKIATVDMKRADVTVLAESQRFLDVTLLDGSKRTIATREIIDLADEG